MYKYTDANKEARVVDSRGVTKKSYGVADESTRLIGEAYVAELNKNHPEENPQRPVRED